MRAATYGGDLADADRWAQPADRASDDAVPDDGERMARALGVFSVGLGLAQILAPRGVARAIGIDDDDEDRRTMRAVGLREIATGVGLLTTRRPTTFARGRVAGDVMDLVLLGRAMRSGRNDNRRLALATAAVAGVLVVDIIASRRLSRQEDGSAVVARPHGGIHVHKAITINRPSEEVYRFWRNLENLPRFMAHVESVRELDDVRSYWKVHGPLGAMVEWTAEITDDRPNELIAWRAVSDSQVPNSGVVRFADAPGGRGTEIQLELRYDPPAGVVGASIARLLGREPSQQVEGDLRRLKQVLETGEVVHSDSSIHHGPHPAQPPEKVPDDLAPSRSRDFAALGGGFE